MNFPTHGTLPGITSLSQTTEKVIWFGRQELLLYLAKNIIGSAAVDDGNTPTTTLRAGLALGRKTSDDKLYEWDPDAVDGTENLEGILLEELNMLDSAGTAAQRNGNVLFSGPIKAADILIEGTALTSSADEMQFRKMAAGRFILDDDQGFKFWTPPQYRRVIAKTADYTILQSDHGTLFHNTGAMGAVAFTLPAVGDAGGFECGFWVTADQSVTVASAGSNDNIVFFNDAAADSLAISTMSEKIGARLHFTYIPQVDKWMVDYMGPPNTTVTVA
jgi:hypothetical protein